MITLKEVRVKKQILEDHISKLINDFEITHSVETKSINIEERVTHISGGRQIIVKLDISL